MRTLLLLLLSTVGSNEQTDADDILQGMLDDIFAPGGDNGV